MPALISSFEQITLTSLDTTTLHYSAHYSNIRFLGFIKSAKFFVSFTMYTKRTCLQLKQKMGVKRPKSLERKAQSALKFQYLINKLPNLFFMIVRKFFDVFKALSINLTMGEAFCIYFSTLTRYKTYKSSQILLLYFFSCIYM